MWDCKRSSMAHAAGIRSPPSQHPQVHLLPGVQVVAVSRLHQVVSTLTKDLPGAAAQCGREASHHSRTARVPPGPPPSFGGASGRPEPDRGRRCVYLTRS